MYLIDSLILMAGILILLGVASSKLSAGVGVPVLVVFLTLGMLAGSEGIGGIEFENYELAYSIGTLALTLILFDGGLRTPLSSVALSWKPSMLLATVGVLITTVITGVAASYVLNISMLEGLLLGSIVGSTDAAAVFSILRTGGVTLPKRIGATLEIESGSNDPMAIFLTIGCLELISGKMEFGPDLLWLFVRQMGLGLLLGWLVGFVAVRVVNRINLEAAGLYPVLVTSFGLLAFGSAAWLGGSGFLSVYVAGIIVGNNRLVFKRGIFLYHDAAAWLSQIVMFIVLGLLSFPSRLIAVFWQGLLIAAVLIFIARPIAVAATLFPFRFNLRELTLFSWVGLKGAVPITLATFPLLYDVPGAALVFDVVFFVVVLSALLQGWTLPLVARRLGLDLPAEPSAPVTLEISSLRHVEGDIVDYLVAKESRSAGKLVKNLALPSGAVIALVARDDQLIPPQGNTRIEPGDHVILVLGSGTRPLVDQVFATEAERHEDLPPSLEFPLRASITIGELEQFYGIHMKVSANLTLEEAIRLRLGKAVPNLETIVRFDTIALRVRDIGQEGRITQVGMTILPIVQQVEAAPAPAKTTET